MKFMTDFLPHLALFCLVAYASYEFHKLKAQVNDLDIDSINEELAKLKRQKFKR